MTDTLLLDGLSLPVVRPTRVDVLCDEVRRASAVYPIGGRTQLDYGLPAVKPGIAIDLTALEGVIDYPARDMTITVQAGIRIAKLQAVLATEKQRLPIDISSPDRATIGGSVAANISGSRRYGAGTLRDYVIGINTVNAEGIETKAGGRVVKNVAGYDLCKLHTGARGTLGIITQVTLKVRPLPEAQAIGVLGCSGDRLADLLDTLHVTRTRPIALDVLNGAAAQKAGLSRQGDWSVLVGFEDSQKAVEWQLQQLIKETTTAGFPGLMARASDACEPLWRSLAELPQGLGTELTFKANLLPGKTASFVRSVGEDALIHAHAGSGIVWCHVSPPSADDARVMLEKLNRAAGAGSVVVTRCPVMWKRSLPLLGMPRSDLALMQRVKAMLDPCDTFNSGRLF